MQPLAPSALDTRTPLRRLAGDGTTALPPPPSTHIQAGGAVEPPGHLMGPLRLHLRRPPASSRAAARASPAVRATSAYQRPAAVHAHAAAPAGRARARAAARREAAPGDGDLLAGQPCRWPVRATRARCACLPRAYLPRVLATTKSTPALTPMTMLSRFQNSRPSPRNSTPIMAMGILLSAPTRL